MAAVVIDPTPLYDELAAALRPLVVDGTLAAPLTAVLNAVTAAVEAHTGQQAALDRVTVERDGLLAQVHADAARARSRIAGLEQQLAAALADKEALSAALIEAGRQHVAHVAALRALHVQANARWGHEGGPSALADAIAAAEATL